MLAGGARQRRLLLLMQAGRVGSYVLFGFVAGTLGGLAVFAEHLLPVQQALWWLAHGMLLAVGLYLSDYWRGLRHIEVAGAAVWRPASRLLPRLLPADTAGKALLAGSLWGWLPCGLVYSLLIAALAAGSGPQGALVMFAFGLGTLPNVLLIGFAGALPFWRQPRWRRLAGVLLITWVLFAIAPRFLG